MLHTVKVHRIRGKLYGVAGDMFLALHILNWLKQPKQDVDALYKLITPDHRDSVDVLELSKEGLALWNGWGVRLPLLDQTFAIGTGAMTALTHVKDGETPEDAVKKACRLDPYSGAFAAAQVEYLTPPKVSTKKRDTGWRKALGDG